MTFTILITVFRKTGRREKAIPVFMKKLFVDLLQICYLQCNGIAICENLRVKQLNIEFVVTDIVEIISYME